MDPITMPLWLALLVSLFRLRRLRSRLCCSCTVAKPSRIFSKYVFRRAFTSLSSWYTGGWVAALGSSLSSSTAIVRTKTCITDTIISNQNSITSVRNAFHLDLSRNESRVAVIHAVGICSGCLCQCFRLSSRLNMNFLHQAQMLV
jgi:hypothetical protein